MVQKLEKFANLASTTLNGAILANATSITVASTAAFPSTGQFRLVVDLEIYLASVTDGTHFAVTSGYEGSTSVGHTDGSTARCLLTAGILKALFPTGTAFTSGPITVGTNDSTIEINNTSALAITVNLPTDPILYKKYQVIDIGGNAATYNITVTDNSVFSDTINTNLLSGSYYYNGTAWNVVKSAASQDISGKVDKTTTVNGQPLSSNVVLANTDVGAPAGSGTSTGTNTGDQTLYSYQVVTASGDIHMIASDWNIEVNKNTPAATNVYLPTSPIVGKHYEIIDGGFNCATYGITLIPNSGTINNASTVTMVRNGMSLTVVWNGTNWRIA